MKELINYFRRVKCDCGHKVSGLRVGKCLVITSGGKVGLWCPECSKKVAMPPARLSMAPESRERDT